MAQSIEKKIGNIQCKQRMKEITLNLEQNRA